MPEGPVRYGTNQWHEHVQHAVKKAAELGLEFHTMNTPGWIICGVAFVIFSKLQQRHTIS
jgi:hypothetical protein